MQMTLWHRRFGHIGNSGITNLEENEKICEPCKNGKLARQPFLGDQQTRSSRPLELIHTDVYGPFKPAAWYGEKMFTFNDDFTEFTAVYIVKAKSDFLAMFRKYSAMAEAHHHFLAL